MDTLLGQRAILTTGMSGIELTLSFHNDKNKVPLIANQDRASGTTIRPAARTTTPVAALISLRAIITSATAKERQL